MVELFDNPPNIRPVTAADVTVVKQEFERGEMYWFASEESGANGTIFVLVDVAGKIYWQWQRHEDTWDGVFEPDVESPPGLFTPSGGFGYVWFMQDLDLLLGFATSGEQTIGGYYKALGDGWVLHVEDHQIELPTSDEFKPTDPEPEPIPEPDPGPSIPAPELKPGGGWVWLGELGMAVNLQYAAWVDTNSLRIGQYDAVLVLPEATATALRGYIKSLCVKII